MKRLLIDAGNTRIKWGLQQGGTWTALPHVHSEQADTLAALVSALPDVDSVWVSNVAGEEVAAHIHAACERRAWPVHFLRAQAQQCGVSNGYQSPGKLGSDRWAALIAARQLSITASLVVTCGTATTIDALSAKGVFMGGLILPGITLMQDSLYRNTAQLRSPAGHYADFPTATPDAIFSGALQATAGAIERQYALLADPGATVLLGGGAADLLQGYLTLPVRQEKDLVLLGIKLIAVEAGER